MTAPVFAIQAGAPLPAALETGLDGVRVVGALAAVTGALLLFLWLLKRGTIKVGVGRGGRQGLAVESALSLGDRRSLVVVKVDGRRLLVGLSPTQVSLLTELAQAPPAFGAALDGALGASENRPA